MLQKLFNPEWKLVPNLSSSRLFLSAFHFHQPRKFPELEFEESLPRKVASIFKEGIGQESNGAANQEKQIFLLCQIWERDYTVKFLKSLSKSY